MIYERLLQEAGRVTTALKPLGLHTQITLHVMSLDYVAQTISTQMTD